MFFVILGRILMLLLIVLAFGGLVFFIYDKFFRHLLVDETVEDIIEDAADRRVINEAKKAANDIEFGDINNTKEDSDEGSA